MWHLIMFCSAYFEPWNNYQHPLVRQLAFAIASPNLLQHLPTEISSQYPIFLHPLKDWQNFYYSYAARLQALDKEPQVLIDFLAQIKSTRLGLRFEALLWFWLQDEAYNRHYQLLGHGIQKHQAGKTLGELDFLVKNLATNEIEHWEVCLKYYLAQPNLQLATWIGLNPDDTLIQKLNHTCQKQFQFETALEQHITKRYAVIKGQLYLPLKHAPLPSWINPERRLGYWHNKILKSKGFVHLSRAEWLCPNIYTLEQIKNLTAIRYWHNSLYYHPASEKFIMLYLKRPSYVFQHNT